MHLFVFGLCGKMGRAVVDCAANQGIVVTGGYDRIPHPTIPTFTATKAVNVPVDAIIDFSRPETLDEVITLAQTLTAPVVLATTGYDEAAQKKIDALSRKVPVFQSGNMSLGINILLQLVRQAAAKLGSSFDIEIIEKHHNQKVDAPSGTAKMLANAVNDGLGGKANFVYGREGTQAKRTQNDVGIHAVRGGTIVGQHEVLLCGDGEVLSLSHTAESRVIFANGALRAAAFLQGKPAGKYNMDDLLA